MRGLVLAVLLAAPLAHATGLLEKNEELTAEGTARFEAGDFEGALQKYDEVARARPQEARAQYNRGLALHKLGRQDDAQQAFTAAQSLDTRRELEGAIHYNLGNVLVGQGKRDEALREYRRALKVNPADEAARHNLEVVLKNLPPKDDKGQDGGQDGGRGDAGHPDAGADGGTSDGGADAGRPDGGAADGGEKDGGAPDGGQDGGTPDAGQDGGTDGGHDDAGSGNGGQGDAGHDGGQGDAGQDGGQGDGGNPDQPQQGQDGGSDGGLSPDAGQNQEADATPTDGGLSKDDAEKLLDSMKTNEKNLQLWRFRQKTQRNDTHGKDW